MVRRTKSPHPIKLGAAPPVRKSTSDSIFETLREAVLSRQLLAGTALIEAQLAEEFSVSKTPIREALQRLTYAGLVDFEAGKGATVHTLTAAEIRDICEMRVHLESLALRQSAPHLSQQQLAHLDQVLADARQALDDENYPRLSLLNNVFHETLYSQCGNHLLAQWLKSLNERRRLISMQGWLLENRTIQQWQEHREILDALQAGDFELAAERLARHITRFTDLLLHELPEYAAGS